MLFAASCYAIAKAKPTIVKAEGEKLTTPRLKRRPSWAGPFEGWVGTGKRPTPTASGRRGALPSALGPQHPPSLLRLVR